MAKKGQRQKQAAKTNGKKDRKSAPSASSPVEGSTALATGGGGHRGLVNLGNTCFLNSILQCLNVSSPFSDELIELSKEGLGSFNASLCGVFRGIRGLEMTNANGKGAVSPKPLHAQFVSKFPWFKGGAQQDAHELLRTLLGSVSDEPSAAEKKAAKSETTRTRNPGDPSCCSEKTVWDSFRGNLCAAVCCWSCGKVSLRLDPFLDISVELASTLAPLGPMGISQSSMSPLPAPKASSKQRGGNATASVYDGGVEDDDIVFEKPQADDDDDGFKHGKSKKDRRKERVEAKTVAKKESALEEITDIARRSVRALVDNTLPKVIAFDAARRFVADLATRILGKLFPQLAGVVNALPCVKDSTSSPSKPFTVDLERSGKGKDSTWGFTWSIHDSTLVVDEISEDDLLDKWNLKRQATLEKERIVHVGDRLLAVNGQGSIKQMQKALKSEKKASIKFAHRSEGEKQVDAAASESEEDAKEHTKEPASSAGSCEAKRKVFCETAQKCQEGLPKVLRSVFGHDVVPVVSNGHCGLEDCLRRFSTVEALEDDFNPPYECTECIQREKKTGNAEASRHRCFASRRFWLLEPLPPILTIQLKRFKRRSTRFFKSTENVTIPALLDLSEFLITPAEHNTFLPHLTVDSEKKLPRAAEATTCRYELYGICAHVGASMESGHYIAYVNTGPSLDSEKWYGASDTKVWSCPRAEALKAEAYVVFYRREGLVQAKADAEEGDAAEEKGASSAEEDGDE